MHMKNMKNIMHVPSTICRRPLSSWLQNGRSAGFICSLLSQLMGSCWLLGFAGSWCLLVVPAQLQIWVALWSYILLKQTHSRATCRREHAITATLSGSSCRCPCWAHRPEACPKPGSGELTRAAVHLHWQGWVTLSSVEANHCPVPVPI